jgi:hypothetical protein
MRRLLPFVFAACWSAAQAPAATASENRPANTAAVEPAADTWSFSASVMGYSIPDDKDYLSPLFTADRGWLHFEARHNYEDLDTASMWFGYNFSLGTKLVFDFTPMVGGVFGHTRGIAPGWRMALSKGAFEFTNETEFVFDAQDSENNFLYLWSELTWSPVDGFWLGLAGQRSRVFQSELDVQRGVLVGFTFKEVDFTAYVFNWGWTDPPFVFSVGIMF